MTDPQAPSHPSTQTRPGQLRPARVARKVVVLSVGIVILAVGAAISPLPGPGFTILGPLGLAILATEFAWAKRLLKNFDDRTAFLDKPWLASPWTVALLIPLIAGFWIAAYLVAKANPEHASTTWMLSGLLFLPISGLATVIALTARRRWLARKNA
ncbi:MAG: PGPGW domain-containing protein [Phycisphaeraceae bacterium]|nr:PGPGW domain-containing protein [Phycisphaeraceae bacterium]